MRTIEILFGQDSPAPHTDFSLVYELYENDFNERWSAAVSWAQTFGRKISNRGNFFGSCFEREEELRASIERSIELVNGHRPGSITLVPYPNMSHPFVLKLHEDFERLEPRDDFHGDNCPWEVKQALQDLNIFIHKYEGLQGPALTHIDVLLHPVDRYKFEKEDYQLFTTGRFWGELYLAYGVTGVPVMHAFNTNHDGPPVPQYNFTAGMTLGFYDAEPFKRYAELDKWLREKWGWTVEDQNLALGYITLGKLQTKVGKDELVQMMSRRPKVLGVVQNPRFKNPRNLEIFEQVKAPPPRVPPVPKTPVDKVVRLAVDFENEAGTSKYTLEFELEKHEVARKWRALLEKTVRKNCSIVDSGRFYGFNMRSAEELQSDWKNLARQFENVDCDFTPDSLRDAVSTVTALVNRYDSDPDQRDKATKLLQLTYKLQEVGRNEFEGHINVDFSDTVAEPLTAEDYKLFTADEEWGGLYLTYGQLGTPTLSGYFSKNSNFDPQKNITAGVTMKFYGDKKFLEWDGLANWLKKTGERNPKKANLAVGSVLLGKLRTFQTKREVGDMIRRHPRIKRIRLIDPNAAKSPSVKADLGPSKAHWPMMSEIYRHLELTPWIMLPVSFDQKACIREAQALMDRFVVHRNYDQSAVTPGGGKWKSLAINALEGDSTKTSNHTEYGVSEPEYRLSEIAEFCPKTLEFLDKFTDVRHCQRVRFMLLEPGAKIAVHSDARDKDWSYAVNVALNMPDGCEFWCDLNPDGTHNPFTRKIPIKDGSAFIFNNAKYHSVVNNSDTPRIHIIVHGPLQISDREILESARKQNGISTHKELMNALVSKYALLGRDVAANEKLWSEWMTAGLDSSVIPKKVRVCVLRETDVDADLEDEVLNRFTMASLFPLVPEIVDLENLDTWLARNRDDGAAHAVVITAGTLANVTSRFLVEILRAINVLDRENAALMGHIINRPNEPEVLPFLHEQFFILDLNRWTKLGSTTLSRPYAGGEFTMPGYKASSENIHDDYTPLWLKPAANAAPRKGREGLGTRLIAKSLENGMDVVNVPMPLRLAKKFAYPRSGRCPQYQEIMFQVRAFLHREESRVFAFNNETLRIQTPPGFQPDSLITVSAGFKPFSLLRQFWNGKTPEKISFIDFSRPAIEYLTKMTSTKNKDAVISVVKEEMIRQGFGADAGPLVNDSLMEVLRDGFDGDYEKLAAALKTARDAEFVYGDFVKDHDFFLSRLETGRKTLIWHSNAWSSNVSLFCRSRSELDENYLKLGREVETKLGLKGWKRSGYHEMIFGKTLTAPEVIITAGGITTAFEPELYRPIGAAGSAAPMDSSMSQVDGAT